MPYKMAKQKPLPYEMAGTDKPLPWSEQTDKSPNNSWQIILGSEARWSVRQNNPSLVVLIQIQNSTIQITKHNSEWWKDYSKSKQSDNSRNKSDE